MCGRDRSLPLGGERLGLGDRHRQHLADVLAAELVLQHVASNRSALACSQGWRPGHHRQVGVDHAGTVARRAGAFGVGAEQGGLDAVGLGERLADWVEQAGVGRGVAAPDPLIADWSTVTTSSRPRPSRRSASSCRPGHAGDHDEHAEGDVDVDVLEVVGARPRTSSAMVGVRTVSLSEARSSRWRPVSVSLARRPSTLPSKTISPPLCRPRTEIDDVVDDRDRLGLVLHDQHRVALVAQSQQQVVHPLDVVRVEPDGRLVEHVGDVGQRRAEVRIILVRCDSPPDRVPWDVRATGSRTRSR